MIAEKSKNINAVKKLIENGAYVNVKNDEGKLIQKS